MKRFLAFTLASLLAACEAAAPSSIQVAAARNFAERCAQSRWAGWKIEARASRTPGSDCNVLSVRSAIALDDSMVETLQYGTGVEAYDIFRGGVQQFCLDHGFHAVVYRDSAGHLWTYGAITVRETDALAACR
jgi:hypothetical protein